MAFGSFCSLFIALCSSSDVAVYFTSEFLCFVSCLHSLDINSPRLQINSFQDKQHQCFKEVLLFVLFQRTVSFSFKSTQKFSRQNVHVCKKRITLAQRPRGLFYGSLSNLSACTLTLKQAQPYNKNEYRIYVQIET